jgi:hypothetical protein
MLKSIALNETVMVTESKPNKWDNLNNVGHEVSRDFSNKKREHRGQKSMSLQQTVRTRTSETYIEA